MTTTFRLFFLILSLTTPRGEALENPVQLDLSPYVQNCGQFLVKHEKYSVFFSKKVSIPALQKFSLDPQEIAAKVVRPMPSSLAIDPTSAGADEAILLKKQKRWLIFYDESHGFLFLQFNHSDNNFFVNDIRVATESEIDDYLRRARLLVPQTTDRWIATRSSLIQTAEFRRLVDIADLYSRLSDRALLETRVKGSKTEPVYQITVPFRRGPLMRPGFTVNYIHRQDVFVLTDFKLIGQ
jgi:hypothetical protein